MQEALAVFLTIARTPDESILLFPSRSGLTYFGAQGESFYWREHPAGRQQAVVGCGQSLTLSIAAQPKLVVAQDARRRFASRVDHCRKCHRVQNQLCYNVNWVCCTYLQLFLILSNSRQHLLYINSLLRALDLLLNSSIAETQATVMSSELYALLCASAAATAKSRVNLFLQTSLTSGGRAVWESERENGLEDGSAFDCHTALAVRRTVKASGIADIVFQESLSQK